MVNRSVSEMPGPGNYTERDYFKSNKGVTISGKQ